MIRSENDLKTPERTNCLQGVAVRVQDGQYLLENYSENSLSWDYLTILPGKVEKNKSGGAKQVT